MPRWRVSPGPDGTRKRANRLHTVDVAPPNHVWFDFVAWDTREKIGAVSRGGLSPHRLALRSTISPSVNPRTPMSTARAFSMRCCVIYRTA